MTPNSSLLHTDLYVCLFVHSLPAVSLCCRLSWAAGDVVVAGGGGGGGGGGGDGVNECANSFSSVFA